MPARPTRALLLASLLLAVACGRPQGTAKTFFSGDDALCLATAEAVEPALAAAVATTRAHPSRAAAWIALGRARLEAGFARADAGELPQVAACARAARQRDVFSVAAVELEASVALGGHRFEEALALADFALAQAPDDVNLLGVRSDALLELGRYREAAQAARAQMQAWPGAAAQARAAHFHWLAGQVAEARRSLVAALRGRDARTPAFNAWLWSELARTYLQEGAYADAALLYARSLSVQPDFPPALLGAAHAALAQQRLAVAEASARRALALAPSVEAAIALGDALSARGETAAAEVAWREAEDLGQRGDTLALARFLAERGRDPARALRLLESMAGSRDGLEFREALAWARYRNGDCAGAAATLAPLHALGVRDARLRLHGAEIEAGCGDPDRAARLYAGAERLDLRVDAQAASALAARRSASTRMVAR